ncbi:hypothetical protein CHS0354_001888 [Potamilus streckersoni]|uniref:Tyrosine-protein kinase ephrin type A/B receptor-like domain-containing protein n=1 Tax=Potamilus streckersoni TaxID=2493646 RepID=A0AAE0W0P7_9BIVA|nr:hypothetical protein CHS0354_001888 [Potamilus streckersoni]
MPSCVNLIGQTEEPARGGNPTAQGVIIYYGKCSDTATQEMIRKNFQKLVEADILSSSFCNASSLCNVGNIQVRCGIVNVRKRRDVQARNQIEVIISVQLPSSLEQTFQTEYDQITAIFQHLEYTLSSLNSSAIVDDLELTFVGIQNKSIEIECPVGTIPAPNMYACVNCSAGTFYDSTIMSCVHCDKGWYQDLTGQLSCKACQEFTTTRTIRAISEDACESACAPGYWSVDGVTPCSPCDTGTYQENYGQIHCIRCRGSQTTLLLAAKSPDLCQEFDIIFPPGQSKNCSLKVINAINTSSVSLTWWIQIRQDSSGKIIHLLNGNDDILSLYIERE